MEAPGERLTAAGPAAARAEARATAYALFARLFRREVTRDLLPTLAEIPELGDALSHPLDPDEAAAEHHRLFALQVPPWGGVFEDPQGRIGGEAAARVRDLYRRAGLEVDEQSEEADHVSHTLDLLAEVGGRPALAAEVLDRALLPWLPWLLEAIERHGGPLHRVLAGLTLELALDHRTELGGLPAAGSAPPIEDPLADPRAGLARVARFLVTPARSGLYLARDDVRALGADSGLPSGFGSRADALETLLRAAAELGGFARVIDRLVALVDAGRAACAALESAGGPAVTATVALRRARLDLATEVLGRLRDAASTA